MIKNIEELKNIQIVCRNQEQVKNCFNYLKQLGFDVEDFADYYNGFNIVFWGDSSKKFIISNVLKINLSIEFYNKELVKTLQKFIKEKQEKEKVEDFEVAKDGRIIKINNLKSKKQIFLLFSRNKVDGVIDSFIKDCLIRYVDLGLVYSTKEARDKAMFKLEIETKLKNIAERLNKGKTIDWENTNQIKHYIYYDYKIKALDYCIPGHCQNQGTIYCLDKNFLEVAKQEIGKENLIKYFEE